MADKTDTVIETLRRGDALEVEHLRDIADTLSEMYRKLEEIHKRGAHVLEKATKRRSDKHIIAMMRDATPYLKKGLSPQQARANALIGGGRPKADREMSFEDARNIWKDLDIITNEAAIRKMKGWNMSAAYRHFGKSGRPVHGRPKRKKTKR